MPFKIPAEIVFGEFFVWALAARHNVNTKTANRTEADVVLK